MPLKTLKALAMMLFLGLFFGMVYAQKSRLPHILVIHSYQTDYTWVPSLNEGLARVFGDRSDVRVRYHYMDLKNHSSDTFRRTAARMAHRVIEEMQPDVVILLDDIAQRLVGSDYGNATGGRGVDMPIVFGGVNAEYQDYYGESSNVTGILERKPLAAIRDTLLVLIEAQSDENIAAPRVQFIGDFSPSITAEIPFYDRLDWAPLEWLDPVQVETFDEWKAAVIAAGQNADMILLTNYQQIRERPGGAFVRPAGQIMKWTEANATVPVLGLGYSNGEDGALLTVSVSPYEQGEMAARLALKVVGGTAPADLEVLQPDQFIVHMCGPTLARRAVEVPIFYEAFARATNHFYETC